MIIAGLDAATTSGLAILDGEKLVHWEAFRPKEKTDHEVFHAFRGWLRAALVAYGVESAVVEEPLRTNFGDDGDASGQGGFGFSKFVRKGPQVNMKTFLRLYGLRAHAVETFCALNIGGYINKDGVLDYEVNNRTWRSQIYGKSSPPKDVPSDKRSEWWKQKALSHCAKIMKWEISSKDAAEAALIAEWLRCQLNPRLTQDLFTQGNAA